MSEGTICAFFRQRPREHRAKYVSPKHLFFFSRTVQTICAQIEGIINGLQYIHSLNVIHGDIKSVRVTSKQLFL
jgi:serine/threonine protein kinase